MNRRGNAAIELIIIMPVIVLALVLMVNVCLKMYERTTNTIGILSKDSKGWRDEIPVR